ncbi:hypothetical protein ABMA27_000649 [Loxostege sticticalis]|uniref:Uncharacterized protein n=1 Tax=Loxostege sticticalis TaxID=481309 RepID=A0ABR3HZV6_LOXSC
MRTYTRKRPVYQAIEGVTELCRLCLGSSDVTVPIFSDDADQLCALSLRIMICVGLEMTRDKYLPNAICKGCYKELERYYTFRKKCEGTYQKLKAHVLAMKERHYNMTIKPKKEEDEDQGIPAEPDEEQEQFVLTFNEDQQFQLIIQNKVNIVNSNSVQLDSSENLFNSETLEELSNEMVNSQSEEQHIVNESVQEDTISPLEIEASSSDLSLIMSTMLVELGVLRQEEDRLVFVDEELNTVELEGADNTKIVLQLVEEDEEEQIEVVNVDKQTAQDIPASLTDLVKADIKKKAELKAYGSKGDTTCPVCNKRFASRSVLTRHTRVHTGARPYACGVCQRRFAQRAVLTRHELVHREKRPFACAMCPKSFTQRGALEQHARGHAPKHARALALHACPACDKVFLYASGLSRHMSVHTGRRYSCASCARAFADASARARHARRHHPPHHPPSDPRALPDHPPAHTKHAGTNTSIER